MRHVATLVFLFAIGSAHAQDLLGYGHSSYAGICGAGYNPASLADNQMSMDILLAGAGAELANNYAGVKRGEIRSPVIADNLYLRERNTKKSVFFRNEVLLPGIMFSNENYGWGIDMKIRSYANIDGVEPELARWIVYTLNDPPHFNESMYNRHIGIQALSWFELGGTYAKTIRSGAEHFLSVGVRPKFLLGLGSAYVFVNDAGYAFRDDSTLNLVRGDVNFGHSDNFSFDPGFKVAYHMGFNPGLGIDAGIIYEYRPDAMQAKKKEKPWPGFRERPMYKYRIGIALVDLGAIHFRHGEFSDHYSENASAWDINDQVFDLTAPTQMYNTFQLRQGGAKQGTGFWMRLPLALNTQCDYYIAHNIYINTTAYTALYLRNWDGKRVHELTRISVTPRFEKRWFAIWAPLSFTRMGTVSLGTGLRLGPLVIGTTDILNWTLNNKKIYNLDLYFVLKVPLFPRPSRKIKGKQKTGGDIDKCPD